MTFSFCLGRSENTEEINDERTREVSFSRPLSSSICDKDEGEEGRGDERWVTSDETRKCGDGDGRPR